MSAAVQRTEQEPKCTASFDAADLTRACSALKLIVNGKGAVTTQYARLSAVDDASALSYTNLSTAATVSLGGTCTGAVLLPFGLLSRLAPLLEGQVHVTGTPDGRRAILRDTSGVRVAWFVPDVADFPDGVFGEQVTTWTPERHVLHPDTLAQLVAMLSVASPSDYRPVFSGLSLNERSAATADGYRLIALDGLAQAEPWSPIVIEAEALRVAAKLSSLYKHDVDVRAYGDWGRISFRSFDNRWIVNGHLIAGQFPNYQQLIPTESFGTIVVPADVLALALRRLAASTEKGNQIVRIECAAKTGLLVRITDTNFTTTEDVYAEQRLMAEHVGDPSRIAISLPFLRDMCALFKGKTIRLALTTPSNQALVTADGSPYKMVVMPMFVQW